MFSFSFLLRNLKKEIEKEKIREFIRKRLNKIYFSKKEGIKVEIEPPKPKKEKLKPKEIKEEKKIIERKKETKKEDDPIEILNEIERDLKKEHGDEGFFFFYNAPNSGDVNLSKEGVATNLPTDDLLTSLIRDLLNPIQSNLNINPNQLALYTQQTQILTPETVVIPDYEELKEEQNEFLEELKKLKLPQFKKKKKSKKKTLKDIWDEYDLIKWKYNDEEFIMAKCIIRWDEKINALKYFVIEDKLNKKEKEILEKVANYVKNKIDLKEVGESWKDLVRYTTDLFNKILEKFYGKELDNLSKAKISYYFYRNYLGLERVEPFMHDPYIEDISCIPYFERLVFVINNEYKLLTIPQLIKLLKNKLKLIKYNDNYKLFKVLENIYTISFNLDEGNIELDIVDYILIKKNKFGFIFEITLDNNKRLYVTPDHKILVYDKGFKYVEAIKLKEGMHVIGLNNTFRLLLKRNKIDLELIDKLFDVHKIIKIKPIKYEKDVYDITTQRNHNFLHEGFVFSHNCDGINIPIFVFHSKPLYGSLETNIKFESKEELDRFVYRLAQLSGRSISIAKPLLDGILPDGSRVQATLGGDIARRGSNFTIRKFRQRILTPIDLIYYGTADENIFVYLWFLIESYKSILIAGPTASGKTTFLNAISLFIKPESKIVTIEDTAELRLPHPNWIPLIERRVVGREKYAEVTMYDLLRAALRQRPDYIIVGEVRGKEANVMFHAMETGHGALATIHAEDINSLIDRLTSPPIEIPLPRIQSLDAVVFLARKMVGRSMKRRVLNIQEIVGYNRSNNSLEFNEAFTWDPNKDYFIPKESVILEKIRRFKGMSTRKFRMEYARRIKLIKYLKENQIVDYKEMFNYIREYYFHPEYVDQLELKEE